MLGIEYREAAIVQGKSSEDSGRVESARLPIPGDPEIRNVAELLERSDKSAAEFRIPVAHPSCPVLG